MILICLSVKDRAADVFGRPFFAPSVASALRSIRGEVAKVADGNLLNSNPEDFDVYELGSFDDQTGLFTMLESHRVAARCIDLVSS